MTEQQRSGSNAASTARAVEPEYQIRGAVALLELALQSLDLENESEQAEAVITALRAAERARSDSDQRPVQS